jgi:tetratricopeptide (TPR) repeat protein
MYQLAPALEFIAKAEQVCVETKRAPKEMAAVLGTKALIHSRAREFDVARAAVEAARQIDPYNPITAGIRAAIAVRCGDMPFAAQALAEAREMPLPARSLYSWYADMAIYQYKKGNVQEALQNADLGIATARRAMPLAVKGAILVREGNTEEALPLLEEAISLDPYFMLAYESRARVYDARGDKQRADEDRARYQPVGFESFF